MNWNSVRSAPREGYRPWSKIARLPIPPESNATTILAMQPNPEGAVRDSVAKAVAALEVRDERALVAVSGGVDSTVLLDVLKSLAAELEFPVLLAPQETLAALERPEQMK